MGPIISSSYSSTIERCCCHLRICWILRSAPSLGICSVHLSQPPRSDTPANLCQRPTVLPPVLQRKEKVSERTLLIFLYYINMPTSLCSLPFLPRVTRTVLFFSCLRITPHKFWFHSQPDSLAVLYQKLLFSMVIRNPPFQLGHSH